MFIKITSIFNYLQFARFSNKISTNRKRQPPEMDDCRCFLLFVMVLALNLHALDSFLCQLRAFAFRCCEGDLRADLAALHCVGSVSQSVCPAIQ